MYNILTEQQIMLAAYHGHAPLVTLLLQHGANPNSRNDRGQTPLAGAIFKNEDAVIEALLAGNADPDFGTPSAAESLVIFGQNDKWKKKFDEAPGRGSGSNTRQVPSPGTPVVSVVGEESGLMPVSAGEKL